MTRDEWRRRVVEPLRARGTTLAAVARAAGKHRQQLQQVRTRPLPGAEAVIARALGVEPRDLWPDRYDEHGRPNRKVGRPRKID